MSLFSWLKSKARKQSPKPPLELREGTAELELFMAEAELETRNDLGHGLKHLAYLLDFDPARPEWLRLLDEYLKAAGQDADRLLPVEQQRYYTHEALRAFIWHRQDRTADAVELLTQVARAKPDSRFFLHWIPEWLEKPGVFESLSPNLASLVLATALNSVPELPYLTHARRRALERFLPLADRFLRAFPRDDRTDMAIAGLFRKAGHFERGLGFLREDSTTDNWHLANAEGLLLRQMGEAEAAEAAFRRASEHDPEDLAAFLEAGDTFFDREDWQRAKSWYDRALERDSDHPWARPSSLFAQWSSDREAADPEDDVPIPDALIELNQAGNARAAFLLRRFQPYEGYLPEPQDASANVLRQMIEKLSEDSAGEGAEGDGREGSEGGSIRLTLSCIEPPSNHTAFALELAARGKPGIRLEVTVQAVPSPDPRLPVEPVDFPLWRYEGTTPWPALPAPASEVTELVAELATSPYDRQKNWAAASVAGSRLRQDQVTDLLATMVHPPPVPDGASALAWLPRVQLAAAMALAHLDDGWETSVRRRALYSVLLGPRDWATEAAITALAELAVEEPAYALDIHEAFLKLEQASPDGGYWGHLGVLYQNWPRLPILFPKEREELYAKLDRFYEED